MIGSAPATFMMSSGMHYPVSAHQQDEYTVAAVFRHGRLHRDKKACRTEEKEPCTAA